MTAGTVESDEDARKDARDIGGPKTTTVTGRQYRTNPLMLRRPLPGFVCKGRREGRRRGPFLQDLLSTAQVGKAILEKSFPALQKHMPTGKARVGSRENQLAYEIVFLSKAVSRWRF